MALSELSVCSCRRRATETFELAGGGTLSGEVVRCEAPGADREKEDGTYSSTIAWTNFTQTP
jgi:hypothetical protein